MIRSREHTYEEVKKLDMGQTLEHYLCTADEAESGDYKHLIRNSNPGTFADFLPFFVSLKDNPAFTDLEEIIPGENEIWLVFPYPKGISLEDFMKSAPLLSARFESGKALFETLILTMAPPDIIWDILDPARIFIDPEGPCAGGFLYDLEDTWKEPSHAMKDVWVRLKAVMELLFAPEFKNHLYPEAEAFISAAADGAFPDIMGGYQEYVKLAPVVLEERTPPKKEKKEHFTLLKKLAKHKKLLALLLVLFLALWAAACAGPYIWRQVVFPRIEAAYLVKTMEMGAPEAMAYTGQVILTEPGTDRAVYNGRLKEGRKEGLGRLYYSGIKTADKEPVLLYDGYFQADRYEGAGILYYRNGAVEYEGDFVKGRKEGEGTAYDRDGHLVYQGGFLNQLYEGEGTLYENEELVFEGGFHRGLYEGAGTHYENGAVVEKGTYVNGRLFEGTVTLRDENGRIHYKGGWNENGRNGGGIAYENGLRIYEGTFKNGLYDGEGTLYSPNTGGVIYEGSFVEGAYSGSGKLYEPGRQYLIYEGGFRLGVYDGEGKEYDEDGNLRYEGNFRLGVYHGSGTYYYTSTGIVLEEGEFRNGLLVTPKELLQGAETGMETDETGEETDEAGEETADAGGDESADHDEPGEENLNETGESGTDPEKAGTDPGDSAGSPGKSAEEGSRTAPSEESGPAAPSEEGGQTASAEESGPAASQGQKDGSDETPKEIGPGIGLPGPDLKRGETS